MQILLSTMHNGAVEGASMGFQGTEALLSSPLFSISLFVFLSSSVSYHLSASVLQFLVSFLFVVLCEVLLKSTHPELYSQPKQWLEKLLDRIEADTFSEELILTRRSSGNRY